MYDVAYEEVLLYFLTEFPTDHQPTYVETVAKEHLTRQFAGEWVEQFWSDRGNSVIDDLVAEFDRRSRLELPVRYEPLDDSGTKVRGRPQPPDALAFAIFQDALLGLTDNEFERLSASVLSWVGCYEAYATPASHDEGLDAFGNLSLGLQALADIGTRYPSISMMAQAKHYVSHKVTPAHVRELVGAKELAKHGIYGKADKRYPDLDMRPYAPVALFIIHSGESTRGTKVLAAKAGIFLLTTVDLFALFQRHCEDTGAEVPADKDAVIGLLRDVLDSVSVAD